MLGGPGNSVGLNVIENFNVVLKAELAPLVLHDFAELKTAAHRVWANIPQDQIRSAFNTMPTRLRAVAKARGGNTHN